MSHDAREENARQLGLIADDIQASLLGMRFAKVSRVLAAYIPEHTLPYSFSPVHHWFVPFDPQDWEWTTKQLQHIVDDPRMRDFMVAHTDDIRRHNNQDSFHWHHAQQPDNKHVYFIRATRAQGDEIRAAALHELMHGLLRQNQWELPLPLEELAADSFSVLTQVRDGKDVKDTLRTLLYRFDTEHDLGNRLITPYSYPSLAFRHELEALAVQVTPDTPLQRIFNMTMGMVGQYGSKGRIEEWDRFCDKVAMMQREGEDMPSILHAAAHSEDKAMQRTGIAIGGLLSHAQRMRGKEVSCNAFAQDDRFFHGHRMAQWSAFETACDEAVRTGSSKPFYAMAARHLADMWQGKVYGYAGDLLVAAGRAWDESAWRWGSTPVSNGQGAKQRFERCIKGSLWQDSFAPLDNIARSYAFSAYRERDEYRHLNKDEKIQYELDRASDAGAGGPPPLLMSAYVGIREKHPELLPDPSLLPVNTKASEGHFRRANHAWVR